MPSNTYDTANTGSAVTTKEQVMEGASLISPEQTPLFSSLDKVSLGSTRQDWNLDDYDDPRIDAVPEGKNPDTYADAFENLAQVFNFTHTLERTGQITDDYELTESYADTSLARAKQKKTIEINRDVEKLLFSENTRVTGNKSGVARQTEGLAGMLTTGSTVFADASDYVIPTAQVVNTTAPTESTVNAVLKSMLDTSGDMADVVAYADSGWCDRFTREVLRIQDSGVNDNLRVNINGNEAKVGLRLKVYDGIHGTFKIVVTNAKCSRDTANLDTALFVNRKFCKVGHLGPNLSINDEPYRHGTREFSIRTKVMPMCTNPKSCANWRSIS